MNIGHWISLYTKDKNGYKYWGEHDILRDLELPEGLWIVTRTKNTHGIEYIKKDDNEIVIPSDIFKRAKLKKLILEEIMSSRAMSPDQIATKIARKIIPPKRKTKKKKFRIR